MTRLIVVGAGIVGSACAYTARRLGADVVLVDADRPGRATSAGAGIICPWASSRDDPAWFSFGCEAARRYPELIGALAADVGYRQVGALLLAKGSADAGRIREQLAGRRAAYPEMGEVQAIADARELFPPLRPGISAVRIGGGARIDGRLISDALHLAAERNGAAVLVGEARLRVDGDRITGVTVAGQSIDADAVVAATGAWTDEFLQPVGLVTGVAPQRGQIMHIGVAADTSRWPVILPESSDHYLLAFDDCRVVVGATRETGSGFDYRVTPGGLAEVLQRALSVAPGLAAGTYLETRIGFRPLSPDRRPVLGLVPGLDGLVIATGLGATGLTMGPFAGEIAARVALGASVPVDLAPFSPLRATPRPV